MLVMVPHTYTMFASGKNFDVANPRATVDTNKNDTTMDKRVGQVLADERLPLSSLQIAFQYPLLTRHNRKRSASRGPRQPWLMASRPWGCTRRGSWPPL